MNTKIKLKIVCVFLITLIILSLINLCLPKIDIDLNGNKIMYLNIGEGYIENGAEAKLKTLFNSKPLKVEISGRVKSDQIGKYIISYKASSDNLSKEIIRVVNVVDNVKPEIILKSKVNVCKNNNLIEYKVEAIDNYDGDITDKIKYRIKNDEITFSVSDNSNNKTILTEKINYIDDEYPKITLKGDQNINLLKGEKYEEYGATAFDSCDGDLTNKINITHQIDINTPGNYDVLYTVSDSNNKKTQIKRHVTIAEILDEKKEDDGLNNSIIYLTFDDGPGQYTEKLLNILDDYNIKATFFVTGQFAKYQHLISEEYKRGHTIGVHTYSHKWSIYESVNSYLEDFNKINNIIYQETGVYSKIFRFPGGSSNTVSRNYSKGIMTKLSQTMEEKGYIYFDWTFDSGDTSRNNNSTKDIIKNFKTNLKRNKNHIVLMHDIRKNTIEAMPEIIEYALSNGYSFDKLSESSPIVHLKIAN